MIAPIGPRLGTPDFTVFQRNWFPKLLWKHRVLIVLTIMVGGCGAFVFLQAAPQKYQSAAQVLVMRRGVEFSGRVTTRDDIRYNDFVEDDVFVTQMLILRSPDVVRLAIKEFQLETLDEFSGVEDPTWQIVSNLKVTRGVKSAREAKVLNLMYNGSSPTECQKVVHAICESYRQYLKDNYKDVSSESIQLIGKARDELNEQLVKKEAAYLTFRKQAPIYHTDNQEQSRTLHQGSLDELARSRAKIFVQQAELQAHISSIEQANNTGDNQKAVLLMLSRSGRSTSNDGDAQIAAVYEKELLSLEIEEQLLLEQYGSDHPFVAAQQRKIKALEVFMQRRKLLGRRSTSFDDTEVDFIPVYLQSKRHELKELQVLSTELDKSFASEQSAAQSSVVYTIQDQTLRHEITRIKQLYENALAQLERMSLVKDYGGYHTQLITPPTLGTVVWPNPVFVYAFGCAIGCAVGVALALLRSVSRRGFEDAVALEQQTGMEVFGQLPTLPRHRVKSGQRISQSIVTYHRPESAESESIRAMRAVLIFGARMAGPRIIQLTAPHANVPTSIVNANLAVSLAMAGRRVLLIDANIRKPVVHTLFGCAAEPGLTDLTKLNTRSDQVIQDSSIENLSILAAGTRHDNPGEVFSSISFQESLESIRHQFDFILVDAPPILEFTDSTSIAACVDQVILAFRMSATPRGSIYRAIESVHRVSAEILGVVLTSVPKDQLRTLKPKSTRMTPEPPRTQSPLAATKTTS